MDFTNRKIRRWVVVLGLVLGVTSMATACAAPAAPVQPTAMPIPQVTVDVSDTGLTAPAEMPSGIVEVTVKNGGEAPHGPLFALPAGEYTVFCFLPDFGSTPPVSHAEHGMVRTLTVTE